MIYREYPLDVDEDDEDILPTEVPLPDNTDDIAEEDEPNTDVLDFCELCGASEDEDEDEDLLRCEECGRLHCASCREYDDEGTPYCTDCFDEIADG